MCSNGSPGISTLPSTPATKPTSSAPIIASPPPCAESNHRRAPVSGAAAGAIFQSIRSAWSYVLRAASSVAMSVLLRPPYGFEGLCSGVVGPEANRPAPAERPHFGSHALNFPLARLQSPMHAGENENIIAHLDELLAVLPKPVPGLELVAGRCLNALDPVIGDDAGQSRHARRPLPHDLGMEDF